MEEDARSGQYPGVLVKRRNSSGCLIVRKKVDGMSGAGSSGPRKAFESMKEKRRPRLILSDSESSDEMLDSYCRRATPAARHVGNVSVGFENGVSGAAKCAGKRNNAEHVKRKGVAGRNDDIVVEKKRSRLDAYAFDESGGIDGNDTRGEHLGSDENRVGRQTVMGLKAVTKIGGQECEVGSGRHDALALDKRKHKVYGSSDNFSSGRNGSADFNRNRSKMKRDVASVTHSLSREKFEVPSDEAFRLQGKNGVLKVMASQKTKISGSMKSHNSPKAECSVVKGKSLACPPFFTETKILDNSASISNTEKNQPRFHKLLPSKKSRVGVCDSEDSDTSLEAKRNNFKACNSMKKVKSGGEAISPSGKVSPSKCKGKVKRGTGTEKQLLREQIRKMLVSAGWSIDYRPRRNRDYLDAVYISPAGTAYWSIIKAYDAFKKNFEECHNNIEPNGDCPSFTPISEDVLNKLTRQTRKKMEKEMKAKQRDDDHDVKEAAGRNSVTFKDPATSSESGDHGRKLSSFAGQNHKSQNSRFQEVDYVNFDNSTSNVYKGVGGRKSRIGRCTLLARGLNKGQNSENDVFVPYTGKRTLLSWMIDSGTLQLSEKVQYMNRKRTQAMLEGWITKDGIHCGCCSKILTVSKFEIHAGSKLRQPFQNIFLESGLSLLQCQVEAWDKHEESKHSGFYHIDINGDDPNDDTCGICGDGGDLICCDGCPSTFHLSCLHIEMLPPGDWHCSNCSCKFCGLNDQNISHEKDSIAEPLLKCGLCEEKCHGSCVSKSGDFLVPSNSSLSSFCGKRCQELYDTLQKFLGVKHELEAGFSWSLIRRTDPGSDTSSRGFSQRMECNSKLAVALGIMDECFLPIVDQRSGINLIQHVVYNCGSNFSRLDYTGFYTAILERGDEIISAASIRIRGTQLAEMPFIGTRHIYRRQGMCRRLFCAIESALRLLKVDKLLIPAISDLKHTWTVVFGFKPLEELHKRGMKSLNMLVFPDTDMLQKSLLGQELKEQTTACSGEKTLGIDHCSSPLTRQPDSNSSMDHEPWMREDATLRHEDERNEKFAATDDSVMSGSSDDTREVRPCSEENARLSSESQGEVAEFHRREMKSLNMLVFPDTDMLQKSLLGQEMKERTAACCGEKTVGIDHCSSPLIRQPDTNSSMDHGPWMCEDATVRHEDERNEKFAATDDISVMSGSSDDTCEDQPCSEENARLSSESQGELAELHERGMKSLNMLVFPDTDMLRKSSLGQEMKERTAACRGEKTLGIDHCSSPLTRQPDRNSSMDHGPWMCEDATLRHEDEMNKKFAATDDISVMSGSSDDTREVRPCSEENARISSEFQGEVAESASNKKFISPFGVGGNVFDLETPALNAGLENPALNAGS